MEEKRHFFVIVNYNGGSHIIHCIHSILQSKKIHPLIIVVDNASTDQSLEQCKIKYPNLIYIYNTHNIGFAAAANIGTRYALERNASTVTYCNPDAYMTPGCAYRLIEAVEKKNFAIVSPLILDKSHQEHWFCNGKIDFFRFRATHICSKKNHSSSIMQSDYISGCIMTISSLVYEKIGLFDERFFLYYEDADISLRARNNGFAIGVIPQAQAFHIELSEKQKDIKTYFLVLSGLLFFDKHARGLQKIWFRIHYWLRRFKNDHDRKKSSLLAESVHKAFLDYEKIT